MNKTFGCALMITGTSIGGGMLALPVVTATTGFWAATLRIACPLIFATLGELICERAGVLNLGVEGMMAFGGMSAFWVGVETGNPWLALVRWLLVPGFLPRPQMARCPSVLSSSTRVTACFLGETIKPNGAPLVFRNEDTGWGWPPYFKFDTADLQTQARNLVSTEAEPQWVAVRHYGWRNQLFSIFPNATSVQIVESPDVRLIPWFNIVFLTILTIIALTIWRLWRNFREARIDPVFDEIDETADEARGWVSRQFNRLRGRR